MPMNIKSIKEMSLTLLLVVFLILLINPFSFWMPSMLHMAVLAGLVVIFAGFLLFVMNERPMDEREQYHQMLANRTGYLAGGTVIMAGIVIQSLNDNLDLWLPAALTLMVLVKMITHARSRARS